MKDERKTKKQLVAELEEMRRQRLVEEAAERIREEVLLMRAGDDLLKVNAVLYREMIELGGEVRACGIYFIIEESDRMMGYTAFESPHLHGISWTSPDLTELDSAIVVGTFEYPVSAMPEQVEAWHQEQVWSHPRSPEVAEEAGRVVKEQYGLDRVLPYHAPDLRMCDTFVPFEYGMIWMLSQESSEAYVSTAQRLAGPLSLAYLRTQDFEELEQQNREIQAANRLKSDFLNRMSHDLRTPMNAIKGYVALLLRKTRDALDDRQFGNLEKIKQGSDNMLQLIDYIQELSQIAVQEPEVEVEDVDVPVLIGDCLDSIASSVQPGVEIETDLQSVGSVRTDPGRVRQVLTDILDNAVRFTDSGKITVSVRTVSDRVVVSVADTGVGISEEDLPHIFDEFYQVARQEGMPQDHSGLSMARAKKSMELLGGIIYAESEVGRGTTFNIRMSDFESPL